MSWREKRKSLKTSFFMWESKTSEWGFICGVDEQVVQHCLIAVDYIHHVGYVLYSYYVIIIIFWAYHSCQCYYSFGISIILFLILCIAPEFILILFYKFSSLLLLITIFEALELDRRVKILQLLLFRSSLMLWFSRFPLM